MCENEPLPKRSLLDPRPAQDAFYAPILDSVNIPQSELADRIFELPTRRDVVNVADVGNAAMQACRWLEEHGRTAKRRPFELSMDPVTPGRLWEPNEFLASCLKNIPVGRAIDLACGTGRDTVYMAAHGWGVTALDILPDALERAHQLAERSLPDPHPIAWVCADLTTARVAFDGDDLAVMLYYLNRKLLREIAAQLRPGAFLVVETFTSVHRELSGRPHSIDRTLLPGELLELTSPLDVLDFSEADRTSGRHTARLLARAR